MSSVTVEELILKSEKITSDGVTAASLVCLSWGLKTFITKKKPTLPCNHFVLHTLYSFLNDSNKHLVGVNAGAELLRGVSRIQAAETSCSQSPVHR